VELCFNRFGQEIPLKIAITSPGTVDLKNNTGLGKDEECEMAQVKDKCHGNEFPSSTSEEQLFQLILFLNDFALWRQSF
jgi:hypothetical protein